MGPSVYGAFDTLSISAMATECERTFSNAKRLFTSECNALSDATIEAGEGLVGPGANHAGLKSSDWRFKYIV